MHGDERRSRPCDGVVAGHRRRLRPRVPRPRDLGRASSTTSTRRSSTSAGSAPGTPRRSSPTTRRRPGGSPPRSTPPRCWSTRRPGSPTAASSASAPRSASHPEAARPRPDGAAGDDVDQVRRDGRRPGAGLTSPMLWTRCSALALGSALLVACTSDGGGSDASHGHRPNVRLVRTDSQRSTHRPPSTADDAGGEQGGSGRSAADAKRAASRKRHRSATWHVAGLRRGGRLGARAVRRTSAMTCYGSGSVPPQELLGRRRPRRSSSNVIATRPASTRHCRT